MAMIQAKERGRPSIIGWIPENHVYTGQITHN